ncbi:kelch domain-containing protein 3, partial [Cichlidogyrus casuarinus]
MPEQWNRLQDAPFARVNHQCISLNDVLYVFGGHNKAFNKIDLESIELDINSYDLTRKVWKKVTTAKSVYKWDGKNKKLIKQNSRADVPTLRFGHTVVVWRSRAWLFGGRSQKSECSNDVYMFCPATSIDCIVKHTFPIWAKGINLSGEIPLGCDGHAAAVLNDCMFIFGGYSETYHGFTNSLHCLDFLAWHWTMIKFVTNPASLYPPELVNSSMESIFTNAEQIFRSDSEYAPSNSNEIPITTSIPIPREFSSMQAHDGRLFLFGGRSLHPFRSPSRDIYDSTLWELLPVTIHHANFNPRLTSHANCPENLSNSELELQVWEENTGHWLSSASWHSTPRRFRCLHHHLKCRKCDTASFSYYCGTHDNQNPWRNGFGYWRRVHVGHGLKTDDSLISLMGLHLKEAKQHRSMVLVDILNMNLNSNDILANHANKLDEESLSKFPLGRRSLSSWSYAGQIYISFGLVICTSHATVSDYSLHFNDLWRFDLQSNQWSCLRNHKPSDVLQNVSYHAMESLFDRPSVSLATSLTVPLPRRRASACLVSSPP